MIEIPKELEKVRDEARRAIAPIRPADDSTEADQSGARVVPLVLPHRARNSIFIISENLGFEDAAALEVIFEFVDYLWAGDRKPAKIYIQSNELPTILTMAARGEYAYAMKSAKDMKEFVENLTRLWERFMNMDW